MNQEKLMQLHSTLSLIKTEGQNTILMANCLMALSEMLQNQNHGMEVGEPSND